MNFSKFAGSPPELLNKSSNFTIPRYCSEGETGNGEEDRGCTCCTWLCGLLMLLQNVFAVRISSISFLVPVTKRAQLSVIVVPVSCSLIAVILIVFGVAYYVQSKNRQVLHLCVFIQIV
jgi:membrane-associated HD superfamily phosphohydrolase